jgi:1-acyl-sn-glycerol-3-phosphate acyltransferase
MSRLIRGIYFWLMGFSVTTLCFTLAAIQHFFGRFTKNTQNGRPVHAMASLWGKSLIQLMPGWRVTIEGRENLPPDGTPVVMVANHESMADIWAMYYLGVQFRWLSKKEVFNLPMIGHAMRWAGYVSVDRKSRESGAEAMRQSANRLRAGLAMFFFPEGTRSADGRIKDFKLGAFKLARDEKSPILPIAIHGAGELFPKGSALPGHHAHIRLRILPLVPPPKPQDGETLETYAARVRQQIIEAHAAIS